MSRVLLIEDSVDCQVMVSRALHGNVDLQIAPSIAEAKRLLTEREFQVLLLDVDLPDGNGFGLCSSLLANPAERPHRVIFLTASRDIEEKLIGFSVGADDYITKPFDPQELRARVLAHLRTCDELKDAARTLKLGNLSVNLGTFSAEIRTEAGLLDPALSPTEFRLLQALVKAEGTILSREQLLRFLSDHGQNATGRTVDAHLSKLRKKLADCTHNVEGVYGIGYRIVRIQPH